MDNLGILAGLLAAMTVSIRVIEQLVNYIISRRNGKKNGYGITDLYVCQQKTLAELRTLSQLIEAGVQSIRQDIQRVDGSLAGLHRRMDLLRRTRKALPKGGDHK